MTPEQRTREFVEVGFESLGVPLEPYVQIITELIAGAEADLRAEIERLQGHVETLRELRKLDRVDIERLRAAHQEIRELEKNMVVSGEGLFMRALLISRAALEPKP